MMKIKPFIKWIGGKRQSLDKLLHFANFVAFNNYFEPFLGGGALYLGLQPSRAFLNDLNQELINVWMVIKQSPHQLIKKLETLKTNYDQEKHYYLFRDHYNQTLTSGKNSLSSQDAIDQAALFIFLNKNGFNGLYRVNKTGKFNVPWNKTINYNLYEKDNLLEISKFLNTSQSHFSAKSFHTILDQVQAQDLVYLDPPYDLLTTTTFTHYTKEKFSLQSQKELAELFKKLANKGCYVMLSNHHTKEIEALYQEFFIFPIPVKRLVSADKNKRKTINEVLITNFTPFSLPFKQLKSLILREKHYMAQNPKWYADLFQIKKEKILPFQKEIQTLKNLTTSSNLKKDLISLVKKNSQIKELLTLIFATRWKTFQTKIKQFSSSVAPLSPEALVDFLDKGNFLTIFSQKNLLSLDDYLWGVEVGLDTNKRKNRTGQIMENWVETIIEGKGVKYWKQKKISQISSEINFSLNLHQWDETIFSKQWDFILETRNKIYFLECNYYDTPGSKIDAVTSQYKNLHQAINEQKTFYFSTEFIWITDGIYWKTKANFTKAKKKVSSLLLLRDFIEKEF